MTGKVNLLNFALLDKNSAKKTVTFEITNDKPNDNGWVNRTQGIDMRRFKKNRAVTLNHNDDLVIGKSVMERMEQVAKNKHRMISEMEPYSGESGGKYADLAMEVYDLIDDDLLVGASVELIPYEAYSGEEANDKYKEDFLESVPKNWRETGFFGRKYMRESSLAKYSVVVTPANADTLKIKNSLSDTLKEYLTYNSAELFEEVFEKESASELIFYKKKFNEVDGLLKSNGLEIIGSDILFMGKNLKSFADERRRAEILTGAKFMAEQIIKQIKD